MALLGTAPRGHADEDGQDLGVRYHAPRRREPGPVVGVAASLLIVLVGAQLALTWDGDEGGDAEDVGALGAVSTAGTAGSGGAGAADPPGTASSGPPRAAVPSRVEVPFGAGQDAPEPGTADLLDDVAVLVLADPAATVTVVGHAEASNDPDLEKQLSLQRALRVVDLLGRRGVPAERVQVVAAGATRAGEAAAGNRRVTVEVAPG
ncbi:OmpA family protein [Jannaschia sp. R86511]|uniref:OmpA family protein n=1 Tax=Jannaschia sp. R86511 TaxID=3093853 RepID=UPI0036D3623C